MHSAAINLQFKVLEMTAQRQCKGVSIKLKCELVVSYVTLCMELQREMGANAEATRIIMGVIVPKIQEMPQQLPAPSRHNAARLAIHTII